MRGLFKWAKSAQHVSVDPVDGVKNPKRRPRLPGLDGSRRRRLLQAMAAWHERADVVGRVAFHWFASWRCGRDRPPAVRNGVATLRTERARARSLWLYRSCLSYSARSMRGQLANSLLSAANAASYSKRNPSARPSRRPASQLVCMTARRMGAARLARRGRQRKGASVAQLNAIFGWSGTAMASLYTQAADRKRLAVGAMAMIAGRNETATSIPSPSDPVRAPELKTK